MPGLLYLDTSALVPLFVREPATDRMRGFLREREPGSLAISLWVATEFASALALKLRTGNLDEDSYTEAMAQWRRFRDGLSTIEIADAHFEDAARICQRRDLALRAGDALHLAVAAAHGCALATLDDRLLKAAPELGVPVADIARGGSPDSHA